MLKEFPVPAPADGRMIGGESNTQCFDIDAEIEFWMLDVDRLKWSHWETDRSLLIELIKFAYDGYILYGGVGQESSWMLLMTRFKASRLSKKTMTSYAEIVFAEVWGRVYGK